MIAIFDTKYKNNQQEFSNVYICKCFAIYEALSGPDCYFDFISQDILKNASEIVHLS